MKFKKILSEKYLTENGYLDDQEEEVTYFLGFNLDVLNKELDDIYLDLRDFFTDYFNNKAGQDEFDKMLEYLKSKGASEKDAKKIMYHVGSYLASRWGKKVKGYDAKLTPDRSPDSISVAEVPEWKKNQEKEPEKRETVYQKRGWTQSGGWDYRKYDD